MKIDTLDIYHVAMPMKAVWSTAFSEMSAIHSIIVRLVADGAEGWAEAAPYDAPNYSPEWCSGAFDLIRNWLGPAIIGREVASAAALNDLMQPFRGNPFAKSAVDIAWWDAFARREGTPLWRLIGGSAPAVTVGADISVQKDTGKLLSDVGAAVDAGFARIKLKFRPGCDAQMIRTVREAFPNTPMHIDCNSGFTLDDLPLFAELDRCGLVMIEQPLAHDDLIDHARLQGELETPLCLDESIVSPDKARKAIDIGACRWINIKVGRVGGLTSALEVNRICEERGLPCWVGGMLESAIGQGPSMALATLPNMKYPADIFPSDRFYEEDLAEPDVQLSDVSTMECPATPGHGFVPRAGRLRALTLRHAQVHL
jgi:o-succinylbenzoate synthase